MGWPANCVAVYSFENNANDLTGNGHNGIVIGNPFTTAKSKLGSYSITNPSGSNYIDLPSSLIDTLKTLPNFSVIVWVYCPSGLANEHFIYARKQDSGQGFCFALHLPSHSLASKWNFQLNSSWSNYYISYNSSTDDNVWRRYNIEWSGTQYKVYQDGTLKTTKTDSNNTFNYGNNTEKIRFLKSNIGFGNSNLYIDKVIFYNGVLNGVDVNEILTPYITEVRPFYAFNSDISRIDIYGNNFQTTSTVYIDDVECPEVYYYNSNHISVVKPILGTSGFVSIKVVNSQEAQATKQNALLILDNPANEKFIKSEIFIEKENLCLNATIKKNGSTTVTAVNDGKKYHYDLETETNNFIELVTNDYIEIDFGQNKSVKKINIYYFPKSGTYYGTTTYTGTKVKIEYYNNGYSLLNFKDFNSFINLTENNFTDEGQYFSNTGILQIYDRTGVTASKIKITALENIAITEVEISNLYILEPISLNLKEENKESNNYSGLITTTTLFDSDYSLYKNLTYGQKVYYYLFNNAEIRYSGLCKIKSAEIDVETRILTLIFNDFFDDTKYNILKNNIYYATYDYNKIFEYILASCDIHRDLYELNMSGSITYFPEKQIVFDEITKLCEASGDIEVVKINGKLNIKSRTQETPSYANINNGVLVSGPNIPVLRRNGNYFDDFDFITSPTSGYDLIAPLSGFSEAETYYNLFSDFRENRILNIVNGTFVAKTAPNYYKLKLEYLNNKRGEIELNSFKVAQGKYLSHRKYICMQYVVSSGQGTSKTIYNTIKMYNKNNSTSYVDTISVDTSAGRVKIVYYLRITPGYLYIYDIRRAIIPEIGQGSNEYLGQIGLLGGGLFSLSIKTAATTSETLYIEGIGTSGYYSRSLVFSANTTDCLKYIQFLLGYFQTKYGAVNFAPYMLTLYSKSENDSVPVRIGNNQLLNNVGNTTKIYFVIKNRLQSATFDYSEYYNYFYNVVTNWDYLMLDENSYIYYLKGVEDDIEKGNINVLPKTLKYLKSVDNISDNYIQNKLYITKYNYKDGDAETIYDDTETHIITSNVYEVNIETESVRGTSYTPTLYIKVVISGNTYEFTYENSKTQYNNSTMQCYILFWLQGLGGKVVITPYGSVTNEVQKIKITAKLVKEKDNETKIKDFDDSQKTYGVIEKKINNAKIVQETQIQRIIKKYQRFLNLPVEFLSQEAETDLQTLNYELSKYIIIKDAFLERDITIKPESYEIDINIQSEENNVKITGRTQRLSDY